MMLILKLSDIRVNPDRQRREFDPAAIRSLRESIKDQGLLHPISVRNENGQFILVAGETRFKAIEGLNKPYICGEQTIEPGHIPVVNFGEISHVKAEELELFENVHRKNLTWQEETDAWARLHKLRSSQNSGQTKAQTVSEILQRAAYSQDIKKLGEALLIQQHMNDPAVAKAKTQTEAMAVVEKKLAAVKAEAIARIVTSRVDRHRVIVGDCREKLLELPSGVVDCIVTDPPYGIDADKHRASSSSEAGYMHNYDDSEETAFDIMKAIFIEGLRVTKPQAHLYMFMDFRYWRDLSDLAQATGWTPYRYPIIWFRGGGMIGDYRRTPQRSYDVILFATKGDRFVIKTAPDCIQIPMLDGGRRHHAAEKPVDLYENLLTRTVSAGATVLDPCCGAGPLFPAANRIGCLAIGIEADQGLANISMSRFEEK
jgi:ParB/RepB/Spo0J family partition protein